MNPLLKLIQPDLLKQMIEIYGEDGTAAIVANSLSKINTKVF